MRRFINLEITGKKENCDEILKNDKIFENKNIVFILIFKIFLRQTLLY